MSNLYEDYGLEMEDEPGSTSLPPIDPALETKKKENGHWFRTIIALVLGVIIGIGSIVGGGFLVLHSPARPTIEFAGGFLDINYEQQIEDRFLAEEYENQSLYEILKELKKSIEEKNLVGVNNIAPVISEYLDSFIEKMHREFGVSMDTDTILRTSFDQLPAYLGETFRTTPLGNMLIATSKVEELEPILLEFCYGEEGVHYYKDENGEIVMHEGYQPATFETLGSTPDALINKISLATVLPPKANDTLMMSMAYGREDITYQFKTNEDGSIMLDDKGYPVVEMLPLFFIKDGDNFYDYNGNSFDYTLGEPENGFITLTKNPAYEGADTSVYYLKEGEDGNYYAYTQPVESVETQATFKKVKIGDLSDSNEILNSIYLKDALNIKYDPAHPENDPHAILFSLAYGAEGVNYTVNPDTKEIIMLNGAQPRTIGDLRERGTDLINDIAISDIMKADKDDALSMYLLYGKKGIHYDFDSNDNLVMLQKFIAISDDNAKVYNEYGEPLQVKTGTQSGYVLDTAASTFTDKDGNTYTYQSANPVKTIETKDGQMKVYYLSQNDEAVLFTKHSLREFAGSENLVSSLTERLSLSEVLHSEDLSENKLLKHVSDCAVNDIPNRLEQLSFTDVFSDEIYGEGAIEHEANAPLVDENGQTIAQGEFYTVTDGKIYKAELKGSWWYLLTDACYDGITVKPNEYLIAGAAEDKNGMNALLENMTANVENATLYKLNNDKIINGLEGLVDNEILRIDGVTIPGVPADATHLGDLTVTEMLHYTTFIMAQLQQQN